MPTAFADTRELTAEELTSAPVRYPSPRQLQRPLQISGAKAAQGAAGLGLDTVGDLLEHLPRDRREARHLGELMVGETATVIVEVRQIAVRPVRRRGMRPLVQATVADATGSMSATFFNQPWLADRYPPGTRLMLHGKADGRGRFTVQAHAPTDLPCRARRQRAQRPRPTPVSPTTRPRTASRRLRFSRWCRSTR